MSTASPQSEIHCSSRSSRPSSPVQVWCRSLASGFFRGRSNIFAGAKAVVEHELALAVAVGVEAAADVGEAVPLRRILQGHEDRVVRNHVGEVGVVLGERKAEVLLA